MSKVDAIAEFLSETAKSLETKEGVDIGLLKILTTYLLTTDPAPDAVALSKEDILRLATERAARSLEEDMDG